MLFLCFSVVLLNFYPGTGMVRVAMLFTLIISLIEKPAAL